MRIISASRRTDIPAFYAPWFMNRIRAGFCHWINPFGGQVYRTSLLPNDVLAIAFWTRNPKPLLPHLAELRQRGFRFYFHYTINGYPRAIESHNPPLADAVAAFQRLADAISPALVHWRYDPILISSQTPPDYHIQQFDALSRQLQGYTKRCYFSFVDFYGKTQRNLRRVETEHALAIQRPSIETQRGLVQMMRQIAGQRGIMLYSCCDKAMTGDGVEQAHCIDLDMVRRLRGDAMLALKAAPTRLDCGCVDAADIGAYDTCVYGCSYCYATSSRAAALARMRQHQPEDTALWRPETLGGVDLIRLEHASQHHSKSRLPDGARQPPLPEC